MDIPLDPSQSLDLVHEAIISFDSKQKPDKQVIGRFMCVKTVKFLDEFQYAEAST